MSNQVHPLKVPNKKNYENSLELILLKLLLYNEKATKYILKFLLAVNIVLHCYSIYGNYQVYVVPKFFTNFCIIGLSGFSQNILLCANLQSLRLLSRTQQLNRVFKFAFKNDLMKNKGCKRRNILLTVVKIIPFVAVLSNWYQAISTVGLTIYQYLLLRDSWFCFLNVFFVIMLSLCSKIKENFFLINEELEDLGRALSAPASNNKQLESIKGFMNYKMLCKLNGHFNRICDIFDVFNSEIRFSLLFMMLSIIMMLLVALNMILECSTHPTIINGVDVHWAAILWHLFLGGYSMGQAAVAAYVGESLEEEGERTSRICFTLLNQLNRSNLSENDALIVKELNFLLDQSKTRKIYLHAGGFLKMNWGILGSIISTVATYSIVIIQFLLNK